MHSKSKLSDDTWQGFSTAALLREIHIAEASAPEQRSFLSAMLAELERRGVEIVTPSTLALYENIAANEWRIAAGFRDHSLERTIKILGLDQEQVQAELDEQIEKDACEMTVENFLAFISEREAIRRRKAAGEPRPWTADPILDAWSFCNVRREDDRVTKWIAENWREPHRDDPALWFAMAVARFVNWPDTLADLGWPIPWKLESFVEVLEHRGKNGLKTFGDAYTIAPPNCKGKSKARGVGELLERLCGGHLTLMPSFPLSAWHAKLASRPGLGSFMAGQIVADTKQAHSPCSDWWTFAASGPGSMRGLARVMGRPITYQWSEAEWREAIGDLHEKHELEIEAAAGGRLCRQDLQSCLCEVDKYERVRLGEGTPKRRYRPHDAG